MFLGKDRIKVITDKFRLCSSSSRKGFRIESMGGSTRQVSYGTIFLAGLHEPQEQRILHVQDSASV